MDRYCSNCGNNQSYINPYTGLCEECARRKAEESLRSYDSQNYWKYISYK